MQLVLTKREFTVVLVLRIWYLFEHSKTAQLLVVASFAAAVQVVTEAVTLYLSFPNLHSEIISLPGVRILELGCKAPPPSNLWQMFVPTIIMHTILYLFTAYRGLRDRSIVAQPAPITKRLIREYVASLAL